MKKENKKNAKKTLASKTAKPAAENPKETQAATAAVEASVAEETENEEPKKEEPSKDAQVETSATTSEKKSKEEEKKPSKTKTTKKVESKNEEPLVPEVVDPKTIKKTSVTTTTSLGAALVAQDPNDRIDSNHAVDLMKLMHQEYITNPNATTEQKTRAKKQFDVMAAVCTTRYFAQLENDFQTMGVKIKPDMREQAEEVLGDYLGIKTVCHSAEDGQMVLEFKEVPEDLKATAIEEAKLAEKTKTEPIPEPDVNMSEKDKFNAMKRIFMAKGKGIGTNLMNGIDWAREAFGFEKTEKPAVVLANIFNKDIDSVMLRCYTGMTLGKLTADHSILGAHALLKQWLPNVAEPEIADIAKVLVAAGAEKRVKENTEKLGRPISIDNELTLINNSIDRANCNDIINGIVESKEQVILKKDDKVLLDTAVNTAAIKKVFTITYGNSDSIIKDKLSEIIKYYTKPVVRLANYVDKSAYAEA